MININGKLSVSIKAVIFDYGRVLTFDQPQEMINSMINILNVEPDKFNEAYFQHRDHYDSGKIDGVGFWELVAESLNLPPLSSQKIQELIKHDLNSWYVQNHDMWTLVLQLRKSYYTALLSNNIHELVPIMEKELDLERYFDHSVFSNLLEFMKPDLRIYQHCIDLLNVKPEEAIFIDDKKLNTDAAAELGMHGIVFTGYDQLIIDLKKIIAF